jgi:hypothetical protein
MGMKQPACSSQEGVVYSKTKLERDSGIKAFFLFHIQRKRRSLLCGIQQMHSALGASDDR